MTGADLRAPFPWFGGKSRAAHLVWEAFGDVPNYVEPFAGSLAVLLARPSAPRIETTNDLDCFLANFWRALKYDPEAVAHHADWPVNEADLHARHLWLVNQSAFRERMKTDPAFYDARIAGWWAWGLCSWIGSGWCGSGAAKCQLPHLGDAGQGVHRNLPHLGPGRGVHRNLPHLGPGRGAALASYFEGLAERLRRVRVCCGDWRRVLTSTPTCGLGLTGVFLDPPYGDTANRSKNVYAEDSLSVAHDVREWAVANGDNPSLRIALCGYEGEHVMPKSWQCVPWKAHGGFAARRGGKNRDNPKRERIWFSPHAFHLTADDIARRASQARAA